MHSLTRDEKAKARVCYSVLIAALIMDTVNEQVGIGKGQPAVQQCTALIDDLLNPMKEERRNLVLIRIQRARIKFHKIVQKLDSASALIAVIEVITGPTFKSRLGTRFDFIRQTLRENLPLVKETLPFSQSTVDTVTREFRKSVISV